MIKNKRGVVPMLVVIVGIILGAYLVLLIPIPAFTRVRSQINYYSIVSLWILLQIGVVYGVVQVIKYFKQGLKMYKKQLLHWDLKIKDFILTH